MKIKLCKTCLARGIEVSHADKCLAVTTTFYDKDVDALVDDFIAGIWQNLHIVDSELEVFTPNLEVVGNAIREIFTDIQKFKSSRKKLHAELEEE